MVSAIIQLRRGVLLTALAFVVSCSVTYSSQDSVEVTGEGTVDEKLNLAREIAAQVWNSGLTIRVHEHFPELTDRQLRGLGIRWNVTTFKPLTGENLQAQTSVVIQCIFSHNGEVKRATEIVQACKSEVQSAIDSRRRLTRRSTCRSPSPPAGERPFC